LVTAHSDKENAAATFKGGFGYHPLMAFLDNTGEALAGVLRAGNAGSNTTADHIEVTDLALAQIPTDTATARTLARVRRRPRGSRSPRRCPAGSAGRDDEAAAASAS
jgi:hypothetical protein